MRHLTKDTIEFKYRGDSKLIDSIDCQMTQISVPWRTMFLFKDIYYCFLFYFLLLDAITAVGHSTFMHGSALFLEMACLPFIKISQELVVVEALVSTISSHIPLTMTTSYR